MLKTLFHHLRLLTYITHYGRLHSAYDFNVERCKSLRRLKKFIPEDCDALRTSDKKTTSLWKHPLFRTLLSEAAYLKRSFSERGGHLYASHHQLVYIRIPKCASTSLSFMMLDSVCKDLKDHPLSPAEINFLADVHIRTAIETERSATFFTVVRNPFARLVSVYRDFFQQADGHFIYEDYLFGIFSKNISFLDFVKRLEAIPDRLKDQHLKPQHLFIDYYRRRDQNVEWLKLESPETIQTFLAKYGLDMPSFNKSAKPYDYRAYYDPEIFRIVLKLYKADIIAFDYEEEVKKLEDFLIL